MEATVSIYGLRDIRSPEEIRYVGKTIHLRNRTWAHINEALRTETNTHKANWIRSLLAEGVEPEAIILEEVPAGEWREAEKHWIHVLSIPGHRLTNATEGGEGGDTSASKIGMKYHDGAGDNIARSLRTVQPEDAVAAQLLYPRVSMTKIQRMMPQYSYGALRRAARREGKAYRDIHLELDPMSPVGVIDLAVGISLMMRVQDKVSQNDSMARGFEGRPTQDQVAVCFLALADEVTELSREFGFKTWKAQPRLTEEQLDKIAMETADIFAFMGIIFGWMRNIGISPEDLAEAYIRKSGINIERLQGRIAGYGLLEKFDNTKVEA